VLWSHDWPSGNSTSSASAPSAAVLTAQSDGQSRRRTRGTATVETPFRASSVNGQVGQGSESLDGGEAQTQPKRLRRATSGSTSQAGANLQVEETQAQRDTSLEAQEISVSWTQILDDVPMIGCCAGVLKVINIAGVGGIVHPRASLTLAWTMKLSNWRDRRSKGRSEWTREVRCRLHKRLILAFRRDQ
jgi:hypothetical protein